MANASAAVDAGNGNIVVASDEDNSLRVYDVEAGGLPLQAFALDSHLGWRGAAGELDIEGGARIGSRVYWIGSQSRNRAGEFRLNRHGFFATELMATSGVPQLRVVGVPCRDLLTPLMQSIGGTVPALAAAARLAPKDGGINVEGLAATPDGGLLLGFRSPLVDGRALLVPLLNPAEAAGGGRVQFGEPVLIDLGGVGVRDMVWTGREYYLVGGSARGGGASQLFRWKGPGAVPRLHTAKGLRQINPEAIVSYGTGRHVRLLLLSDDGRRSALGGSFRSLWVNPGP